MTKKPFNALTAADLMSTELTIIPQDMSLRGAAHLLSQANVTGAPVVNEDGRCVGVLSSTDFVHWVEQGPKQGPSCGVSSSWQIVETDRLPLEHVKHYMTSDPVTATPSMPVAELARMMVEADIHRIIVIDRNCRPVGVVSSTDILAAVSFAAPTFEERRVPERCAHLQGLGAN